VTIFTLIASIGISIDRIIFERLKKFLVPGKVNIIHGARRVGKTSLMKRLTQESDLTHLWLDGELPETHDLLKAKNLTTYDNLLRSYDMIFIDEAQEIPDIGKALKIMVDNFPEKRFIASGSSTRWENHL